jgi:hypothetical protein
MPKSQQQVRMLGQFLKAATPPPVPYSEYKRVLRALNILQSQWQALLEENHELRMQLAARPTEKISCSAVRLSSYIVEEQKYGRPSRDDLRRDA